MTRDLTHGPRNKDKKKKKSEQALQLLNEFQSDTLRITDARGVEGTDAMSCL